MRILIGPHIYSNPYCEGLEKQLRISGKVDKRGRWRLFHKYDICVVNWIENKLVGRSLGVRVIKFVLTVFFMTIQRLTVKQFLMVLHNRQPHSLRDSRLLTWQYWLLYQYADLIIVHSTAAKAFAAKTFPRKRLFYYRLPSYASQFPSAAAITFNGGNVNIGFLGHIRAYKGVEDLIDAFWAVTDPLIRLIVAGEPESERMKTELNRLAKRDPRITLRLRFQTDTELFSLLSEVDVVVLPYTGPSILTSAVAALCGTVGVPFIARKGPPFEEYEGLPGVTLVDSNKELIESLRAVRPRSGHCVPLRKFALAASWEEFGGRLREYFD